MNGLKWRDGLTYALFIVVFIYLAIRSYTIPFVHDESETFFIYITTGHFLPYEGYIAANNHFLNSFLAHLCFKVFGPHQFWIRLPNLLSTLLYFYFLKKMSNEISDQRLSISFLLTLSSIPFFMEFFALARGYGLAMAFLMGSLYHTAQWLKKDRFYNYLSAQSLLILSLFSSLTVFPVQLLFTAITIIHVFLVKSQAKFKVLLTTLLIGLPVILFVVAYVKHLGANDELLVGSLDGFFVETVSPLVELLMWSNMSVFVWIFAAVFLFLMADYGLIIYHKGIQFLISERYFFHLFLLGSIVIILISAYIFSIPFPHDRAAMYLIPIFFTALFISLDGPSIPLNVKKVSVVLLLFFPASMISKSNLTHVEYWKEKPIHDSFYNQILKLQDGTPHTIGGASLLQTSWYHKIFKTGLKLNPLFVNHSESNLTTDFKIQPKDLNPEVDEYYEAIAEDKPSGNKLFKRISFLERELHHEAQYSAYSGKDLYHTLLEVTTDVLNETGQKSYVLNFQLDLSFESQSDMNLVVQYFEDDQYLGGWSVRLNRLKHKWKTGNPQELVMTADQVPERCDRLIAYVFNKNQMPCTLKPGSVKLYKLVRDF